LCRGSYGQRFLGLSLYLIRRFSDKQPTINASYSNLHKYRVMPAFRSKRVRSVRSVCLLHNNVRPHTATVTTRTLQEMYWEVLPHPACSPDLAPCEFHLSSPIKETLGGKYLDPTMNINLLCDSDWSSNHFLKGV
jgi:hypothetical protein